MYLSACIGRARRSQSARARARACTRSVPLAGLRGNPPRPSSEPSTTTTTTAIREGTSQSRRDRGASPGGGQPTVPYTKFRGFAEQPRTAPKRPNRGTRGGAQPLPSPSSNPLRLYNTRPTSKLEQLHSRSRTCSSNRLSDGRRHARFFFTASRTSTRHQAGYSTTRSAGSHECRVSIKNIYLSVIFGTRQSIN